MSNARSKRSRKGDEEEADDSERWTISYMDMVTVMMCLFIVLFSISQVDQQKLQALATSLGAAFSGQPSQIAVTDGSQGILEDQPAESQGTDEGTAAMEVPQAQLEELQEIQDRANQAEAQKEVQSMESLRSDIQEALDSQGLGSSVSFRYTQSGLVIGLVKENVFFAATSAELSPAAAQVVDVVGGQVRTLPNQIVIEGHANVLQGTAPYESNWELSADRAVKVLRRMVETGGVPANRIGATGYGDARPLRADGPDAMEINRRVDIIVESQASDAVRQEVAELLKQSGKDG